MSTLGARDTARTKEVSVTPHDVWDTLRGHLLVDDLGVVLDQAASRGGWLVDARDGTRYLDMFGFFGSNALGMNHPALVEDADFRERLARTALHKPSNSDMPSVELAAFVETFLEVVGDPALPRLFLIDGGALAVENALKVAFDWKSRRNEAAGRSPDLGTRVLHLRRAFHGRSGYTLSLTNTEPVKTARFPKLEWPRIDVPAVRFPLDDHLDEVAAAEQRALAQARDAFERHPDDIACFIAEPIQGEGGDNHLRAEFLQAVQALCHAHDALFVLDEVQTGCGLTGSAWAYQQLGLEPDLVAFGKKLQVCGVMAGRRVLDVEDNVFSVPGRLNSTWGGNLTDMVRAQRILQVIRSDGLIERAAALGKDLLDRLREVEATHPALLSNARGRGLMCAIDLPDATTRDAVVERLRTEQRVLMLPCGERSVRFRPALTVTGDELAKACDAISRVVDRHRAGLRA
jgi:L-lysine 6-transaminase